MAEGLTRGDPGMIWAKREFTWAEYGPYQDRLAELMLANAPQYREFMMVGVNKPDRSKGDYYVGLPSPAFLALFDGFEVVPESELPRQIDCILVADATTDEFRARFAMRERA
jgi:hypothetical protein